MIYLNSLKAFSGFYELVGVDLYHKGHTRRANLVEYKKLVIASLKEDFKLPTLVKVRKNQESLRK